jgi:hypothetical protein
VATGDFNGDGFDDIVTANRAPNTVSVLINAADWPGGRRGTAAHFEAALAPASAVSSKGQPEVTAVDALFVHDESMPLNPLDEHGWSVDAGTTCYGFSHQKADRQEPWDGTEVMNAWSGEYLLDD